jgi:hypothetical protein
VRSSAGRLSGAFRYNVPEVRLEQRPSFFATNVNGLDCKVGLLASLSLPLLPAPLLPF